MTPAHYELTLREKGLEIIEEMAAERVLEQKPDIEIAAGFFLLRENLSDAADSFYFCGNRGCVYLWKFHLSVEKNERSLVYNLSRAELVDEWLPEYRGWNKERDTRWGRDKLPQDSRLFWTSSFVKFSTGKLESTLQVQACKASDGRKIWFFKFKNDFFHDMRHIPNEARKLGFTVEDKFLGLF